MPQELNRPFSRGFEQISKSVEITNDGKKLDIKTDFDKNHPLVKDAVNNIEQDAFSESELNLSAIEEIELAMDALKKKGILKFNKK